MLKLVVCIFAYISFAHAWPEGAPQYSCDSMIPQHSPNVSRPIGDAPYGLAISSNTYAKGKMINITITNSSAEYSGLFVQVRQVGGDSARGRFTLEDEDDHHQYMTCGNPLGAITQTLDTEKPLPKTFSWNAPTDKSHGDLQFFVVMITDFDEFYGPLLSEKMIYDAADSTALSSALFVVSLVLSVTIQYF